MRKIIKFTLGFLFVIGLILIFMVQWIDRTPFKETRHYAEWKKEIAELDFNEVSGDFSVGWAIQNITPAKPAPLAGYGKRKGKHYEAVHDSIFVRSVAVKVADKTAFFVSADLLFIPPKVIADLTPKLTKEGITLKDVHFAATHSHSSIGGWESTLTGELFGGKYDPEIVKMLSSKFLTAILSSKKDLQSGSVYYSEVIDDEDVRYRLKLEDGKRDLEIRSLTFEKKSGEKAHLLTYAAHSTVLSDKVVELSRDYSGALVDSLRPDFALFMAGAVASMGPIERGLTEFDELKNQAYSVLYHFNQRKETELGQTLMSDFIKIPMPEPTGRLTKNFALRPWVFKKFFGDYDTYVKVTKVGSTLVLGMPADFSGEIMIELDAYARKKGIDLIITSFNGGYIGYVTPDKIYDSGLYETLTMSWYGYQNGGYFTQLSKDIIDKASALR